MGRVPRRILKRRFDVGFFEVGKAGFYSPDLEGFTGIGHSIEDCLYQAKWGMEEHLELLKEQSLPIPKKNSDPKIVIQNQEPLAEAS